MIARARGTVDAGFLARRLRLSPEMAQTLMRQMVSDGVIKAPGLGGLAKAVKPFELDVVASHPVKATSLDIKSKLQDAAQKLDEMSEESHGEDLPEETEQDT
jgi:DNA-binding Lrp family transcriptional regulator